MLWAALLYALFSRNTFYLRLYGVRHMVKDYSDRERVNPLSITLHKTYIRFVVSDWGNRVDVIRLYLDKYSSYSSHRIYKQGMPFFCIIPRLYPNKGVAWFCGVTSLLMCDRCEINFSLSLGPLL